MIPPKLIQVLAGLIFTRLFEEYRKSRIRKISSNTGKDKNFTATRTEEPPTIIDSTKTRVFIEQVSSEGFSGIKIDETPVIQEQLEKEEIAKSEILLNIDPDEKAEVLDLVLNIDQLRLNLEEKIPRETLWIKNKTASKFLITAEYLYNDFVGKKNDSLDSSAIVLQLAKVVEILLRNTLQRIIERDHPGVWYGFQLDKDIERIKPGRNLASWVKLYEYKSKEYTSYLIMKFRNDQNLINFLTNYLARCIEPIHRARGAAAHTQLCSIDPASRIRNLVLFDKVYMNTPLILWLIRIYDHL